MDFEAFENEVFNFIKDNLKNYIDEINTRKTDIVLQYPNHYLVGYPNPVIETAKVNLYLFNFNHTFEPYSNNETIHNSSVNIYVTIRGYDDATIEKYLKRYKEAIYNLIAENESLGGLVYQTWISEIPRDYWGYESINNIATVEMIVSLVKYN